MSYSNVILYGATLPTYNGKNDKDGKPGRDEEIIRADDPKNKEKVKKLLQSFK